jgi:hypothetical protein
MVLDWTFDIPQQKVYCKLDDNLEYIAIEGGSNGFTKIYNDEESFVSLDDWREKEKYWLSEVYGEQVGYYQPRPITLIHPESGETISSVTGIGPDGRGLDHMQRRQIVMEGFDHAKITTSKDNVLFVTPDCGKTIYKREPTVDVDPKCLAMNPDGVWHQHPQPCLMHPRSEGLKVSSYQEMRDSGIAEETIIQCERGERPAPKHPELQKFYVYPS